MKRTQVFNTGALSSCRELKGSDVLKVHPCLTDDRPSVHRSRVSVRSGHSESNQTFLRSNLRLFSSVSYVWKETRTGRKADYIVNIQTHFPWYP